MVPHDALVSKAEADMTGITFVHVVGSVATYVQIFQSDTGIEPKTLVDIPLIGGQSEELVFMTIVVFGVRVVGVADTAVEQQLFRVFLYLVAKEIHRGVGACGVEPVVYLCAPAVASVFGFARQFCIGHPGMFEAVEMQHASRLYLASIDRAVFVSISAFGRNVAYTHDGGNGTERVTMFELAVDGQFEAAVPSVVEQEVHVVYLVDVRIVDILFLHQASRHIQVFHLVVGRAVLVDAQPEAVIRLHAAVTHEDKGTVNLVDLLELRILVDESCLATAFVPGLRECRLIEVDALLQGGHVEVVAPGIHIMIGADAEAPAFSDRRGDIGINSMTAKVIKSVVDLAF